jgi:hypothetical protein
MAIDMDKLNEFVGRFVADLGATVAAGNVVIGHRLGLFQALATGSATAEELAERTSTNPRYIAEWLRGQAAGGYIEYDADADRYSMTEEQAFALLLCVPNAMSQPGGYTLGAQAGEAAIRQVVTQAGFTRFRRAAQTPFNLVFEVRP